MRRFSCIYWARFMSALLLRSAIVLLSESGGVKTPVCDITGTSTRFSCPFSKAPREMSCRARTIIRTILDSFVGRLTAVVSTNRPTFKPPIKHRYIRYSGLDFSEVDKSRCRSAPSTRGYSDNCGILLRI